MSHRGAAPAGEPPALRAVLFDAVATLIRPWPSVGAVYARAGRAAGLRCSARRLQLEFRTAYHELLPERFAGGEALRTSEGRERRWWRAAVTRTFERSGCGRPPRRVVDDAFAAFGHGSAWRPYADVLPVLARLREAGLSLAVVSNYDSRLHRVLDDLGLRPYFDAVIVSSECGYAKPSPRIYRRVLDALGVPAAAALFVGDRLLEDYEGPRRAGLRACLLSRSGSRRGPGVISRLGSLPSRITRLAAAGDSPRR